MRKTLLLDTCALLWLVAGGGKLSAVALKAIDDADIVLISAISAWEIGLKQAKGQLELPISSEAWFARALKVHNLVLAELSVEVLTKANDLPWHHRDPADRFIIATAVLEDCPVITTDHRFSKYEIAVLS